VFGGLSYDEDEEKGLWTVPSCALYSIATIGLSMRAALDRQFFASKRRLSPKTEIQPR
jgi:hypothetical protein